MPLNTDGLLAAGTVVVWCGGHSHVNEEEWKDLETTTFSTAELVDYDRPIALNIHNLLRQRYIKATYRRSAPNLLHIRIYIIPVDLNPAEASWVFRRAQKDHDAGIKALRLVLARTHISPDVWHHRGVESSNFFFSESSDLRSLSNIFAALPSPHPDFGGLSNDVRHRVEDVAAYGPPFGMRSTLFPYQRATLARMLQQEICPGTAPDPTSIAVASVTNPLDMFYLSPTSLQVRSSPDYYAQQPGGILCEEMGSGKTVITLSLILSTRDDLPKPEEESFHSPPILTHLGLRHFPFPSFAAERNIAGLSTPNSEASSQLPSLVELSIHRARTAGTSFQHWKDRLEDRNLYIPLMSCTPYYHRRIPETLQRGQRSSDTTSLMRIYLSSATLLVVPAMLFSQWQAEIIKHTEDEALRVLLLGPKSTIPSAPQLATNYDIILITQPRLSLEASRTTQGDRLSTCLCPLPPLPNPRIPECTCDSSSASPLLQCRFKRLIVDEGHVCAFKSGFVNLLSRLSVERRWIVSGTPTKNMLALNMGSSATPIHTGEEMDGFIHAPRIWTKHDREDLRRLGLMVESFLGIAPFQLPISEGSPIAKRFKKDVTDPLCDSNGPQFGAIRVLMAVMKQVMFRHRIEDVSKDVELPLCKHETVLLDLDKYAAKTYNIMQTTIAINAVDSERTGQDYFFSPQNVGLLRVLLQNTSQALFWHVDEDIFDIDKALVRSREALLTARNRGASDSDIKLVEEAIKYQQDAARDPLWRSMMMREEVPYRVSHFSSLLQRPWSRLNHSPTPRDLFPDFFMHPTFIVALRRTIMTDPDFSSNGERLIFAGNFFRSQDEDRDLPVRKPTKHTVLQGVSLAGLHRHHKPKDVKLDSQNNRQRMNDALHAPWGVGNNSPLMEASDYSRSPTLPIFSEDPKLGDARISGSCSVKINFIISEVLRYCKEAKFLIFSVSAMSLAHVSEALSLVDVPFLELAVGLNARSREQAITTFETSDKTRVLLMELKHGSRGLNLLSASRIIFCEPVFDRDVEAQAIKRAHRIGQTREIVVKTLAIRATYEEEIMAQRMGSVKISTTKEIGKDEGMRKFIKDPKFILPTAMNKTTVDIPLVKLSQSDIDRTHAGIDSSKTTPRKRRAQNSNDKEPPMKRTVRFI